MVKKLKERGMVSPYLRSFVVARINPLHWIKGECPCGSSWLMLASGALAKVLAAPDDPRSVVKSSWLSLVEGSSPLAGFERATVSGLASNHP
jgi:hypothetical protein